MSGEGKVKTVESILEESPEDGLSVEYYLILFDNRPLQVIPPANEGPHLVIFSQEDKARAFIRERMDFFGEEPLSIAPQISANKLHRIAKAPSLDPRYEGPPCGLTLDFSYKNQAFEKLIRPNQFDEISFGDLAVHLGEPITATDSIASKEKPPNDHVNEEAVQAVDSFQDLKVIEEEQARSNGKFVLKLSVGILSLLLIATIILVIFTWSDLKGFFSRSGFTRSDVSNTPQITSTPLILPTLTPTTAPEYVLLRTDDFSGPFSGWEFYEEEGVGVIDYNDGIYEILIESSEYALIGFYDRDYEDVQIEISAHKRSGPSDSSYGLACRLSSDLEGYAFLVSPSGSYAIGKWVGDDWIQISDWKISSSINEGSSENIIKITCKGDKLSLSVNGRLLQSVEDDSFKRGAVGVVGSTSGDVEARIEFDDFKVYIPYGTASKFQACLVADVAGMDDASLNELAWKGIQIAEEQFNIRTALWKSIEEEDYQKNIELSIDDGCDLVVTTGFFMSEATKASAENNPSTIFTVTDFAFDPSIENILAQIFFVDEASFLAGYLAAGMTQTGKVATFGGMDILPVTAYMDGFALGVEHYNSAHSSNVMVIGWDPHTHQGEFIGNFEYEIDGLRVANQFLDQGADIIFPVAWPAGVGAVRAADERGELVIGVDVDWKVLYPDYREAILTSVVKNFDNTVVEAIRLVLEGDLGEGIVYGALGNGGVALAPDVDDDAAIPEWLKEEIAFIRGEIIQGRILTYLE